MRRIIHLSTLCLAAGALSALSACKPDEVVETTTPPTAGVRFINAVPDTGGSAGLDFRFVDLVENSSHFKIPFRNNIVTTNGIPGSTLIEYKNTQAGQRHLRIFLSDTLQAVAQTVLKDTTITIEAGKRYTAILWGNARSGQSPAMRFTFVEDAPADPASNVALRVINTTGTPVDVREYLSTGTLPAAATWTSVPALGMSNYVTSAPGTIRFNVQPAGGGSTLFAEASALLGAAGTVDLEAIPGTTIPGSAVSAIIWPRSVAGSKAAQFSTPAISFTWDRRPPRTCALC
ncbi:protein of unknown function DUF4397 [Gemmatirosa kalamazoonensis]|uniref:DUF4397 domain-containing protein n=1 Tax=Gemmatirosa kalamazoonensis TaxID=861299 RepID=W0RIQ9_9BACT|nr:DUF4397 domain-containing protein [Gemmatirosa kalamazoonensis]AHG89283.1 protein of unknown function DUF4397 [Gemmatirosa kalamazoonensis]